jgi:mono/diheme cytochrome c family protein
VDQGSGDFANCAICLNAVFVDESDFNDCAGMFCRFIAASDEPLLHCAKICFCEDRNVKSLCRRRPGLWTTLSFAGMLIAGYALSESLSSKAQAGPWHWFHRQHDEGPPDPPQEWQWVHSADQQQVVVAGLFNRYCIRCHGVDGRGVWDIPFLPDFTDVHFQATHSNAMIARAIYEGRRACMPAFRDVISCKEAWALALYVRTFVPGTELAQPVIPDVKKAAETPKR